VKLGGLVGITGDIIESFIKEDEDRLSYQLKEFFQSGGRWSFPVLDEGGPAR
jgi:hypothetical protein